MIIRKMIDLAYISVAGALSGYARRQQNCVQWMDKISLIYPLERLHSEAKTLLGSSNSNSSKSIFVFLSVCMVTLKVANR